MPDIITTTNQIGKVIADSGIETYVKNMVAKWQASLKKSSWFIRSNFVAVTNFLISAIDDVIAYVETLQASGPDKKATVINTVAKLYDTVIFSAMPLWLKPFSPLIRAIVINQIIPAAIDFFVNKYNNSSWVQKDPEVVAQLFGVPGDHRPS